MFCKNCGAEFDSALASCPACGAVAASAPTPVPTPIATAPKSKLAAGLLAIFLGYLGIHNFYLGYTKIAIIQIAVSAVTCGIGGGIWGIIDAIRIFTGGLAVDAKGVPLAD